MKGKIKLKFEKNHSLKTEKAASEVIKGCMEKGVLCLTAKDKVRLLPALNIPDDLLQKAAKIIKEACSP